MIKEKFQQVDGAFKRGREHGGGGGAAVELGTYRGGDMGLPCSGGLEAARC